ncbi:MAG: hypothetical protein OXU77_20825, partial [Gammaproteobacteria bacterium]|nr:hypothetical protein [Gammaproteobacteria bacterium]
PAAVGESTMAREVAAKKGVFCLETDQWYRQKDRSSMEPALQLVELYCGTRYEHRDVATTREFEFFLRKYLVPGYENFPILYLGFHGWYAEDGADAYVEIRDGTRVTLIDLEKWIGGQCRGRLIYFGACGVMNTHGNRLNRFVRDTGAVAVAGYREEVDWLEAAAFDVLALGRLQDAAFTKSSIRKFNRELRDTAKGLYDRLGFRLILKD